MNATDSTNTPTGTDDHRDNPAVAFLIGLAIVLAASVLNAGGLNITKLDHIRTSALPKEARRRDFLRPLWVTGMLLYILSQLIGSTLALAYMRAEYVAPLGSTSLIFNFLFASLIGIPVSRMDVYGTIVVVLGVVGIVAFGSINSGLESEIDLQRLNSMWSRAGWIVYFIFMSLGLIIVYIGSSQLEVVLQARSDLTSLPVSNPNARRRANANAASEGFIARSSTRWENAMGWLREKLDVWTGAKDDKYVAWMLGIGWSCNGGGLAGACLIFAKATVKLLAGSLSHKNQGSQFAHVAPILTVIFLAITAVTQIICLNRGLKVYDSTLVVPVFYGIYTASGFLNSLIFNNEVDAYKTWTLFCLFLSILVLIAGVVMLTHKKPEPKAAQNDANNVAETDNMSMHSVARGSSSVRSRRKSLPNDDGDALPPAAWEIGEDDSDSDDASTKAGSRLGTPKVRGSSSITGSPVQARRSSIAAPTSPNQQKTSPSLATSLRKNLSNLSVHSVLPGGSSGPRQKHAGEEGKGLMHDRDEDDDEVEAEGGYATGVRRSPELGRSRPPLVRSRSSTMNSDEFGDWEDGMDTPTGTGR